MPEVPKVSLGSTELRVSKLGFGPFNSKTSPEEGSKLLIESYKLGINFWDTSDDYGTYPQIASALKSLPRKEIVLSTKTYAKNLKEATKSLNNSLKELGIDYVDVFLLHCVESNWAGGCHRLLEQMTDLKRTGVVKAIGLSTHSVKVAKKAASFSDLDVIMAICCKTDQALIEKFNDHIPLEDGSIEEMFGALKTVHHNGKGVIAMKVLGGKAPPLIANYETAIKAVAKLDFVDAMVIGMRSFEEIKKNIKAIASN